MLYATIIDGYHAKSNFDLISFYQIHFIYLWCLWRDFISFRCTINGLCLREWLVVCKPQLFHDIIATRWSTHVRFSFFDQQIHHRARVYSLFRLTDFLNAKRHSQVDSWCLLHCLLEEGAERNKINNNNWQNKCPIPFALFYSSSFTFTLKNSLKMSQARHMPKLTQIPLSYAFVASKLFDVTPMSSSLYIWITSQIINKKYKLKL